MYRAGPTLNYRPTERSTTEPDTTNTLENFLGPTTGENLPENTSIVGETAGEIVSETSGEERGTLDTTCSHTSDPTVQSSVLYADYSQNYSFDQWQAAGYDPSHYWQHQYQFTQPTDGNSTEISQQVFEGNSEDSGGHATSNYTEMTTESTPTDTEQTPMKTSSIGGTETTERGTQHRNRESFGTLGGKRPPSNSEDEPDAKRHRTS